MQYTFEIMRDGKTIENGFETLRSAGNEMGNLIIRLQKEDPDLHVISRGSEEHLSAALGRSIMVETGGQKVFYQAVRTAHR